MLACPPASGTRESGLKLSPDRSGDLLKPWFTSAKAGLGGRRHQKNVTDLLKGRDIHNIFLKVHLQVERERLARCTNCEGKD
jgi:hypothetical protein